MIAKDELTRSGAQTCKRLDAYWKMEAANIILLPAVVVVVVSAWGEPVSWLLALALAVNSVLLLAGACYWRIVYLRLVGDVAPFQRWIPVLARAEPLMIILVVIVIVALVEDVLSGGREWNVSRWTEVGVVMLAALEYVNYYRWQLQYFDHAPDFSALLKRQTLKKAHMARDIERWKRASSRASHQT